MNAKKVSHSSFCSQIGWLNLWLANLFGKCDILMSTFFWSILWFNKIKKGPISPAAWFNLTKAAARYGVELLVLRNTQVTIGCNCKLNIETYNTRTLRTGAKQSYSRNWMIIIIFIFIRKYIEISTNYTLVKGDLNTKINRIIYKILTISPDK